MKKVLTLILAIAAYLWAPENSWGQERETRSVGSFSEIGYSIPGELRLRQGDKEEVILEGQQKDLDRIKTEVEGNRLSIKTKDKLNWRDFDGVTVYVTLKKITSLNVAGSGKVIGENTLKTGSMGIKVAGSGDTKLTINASGNLEIKIAGSGDVNLKGTCRSYESGISGSGNFVGDLIVEDRAEVSIAGSGKVKLSGSCNDLIVKISGSGSLSGTEFETKTCDVSIGGSGSVSVAVKEELDVKISGSGSVAYKGNPSKVNSHSSGSGSVRKI